MPTTHELSELKSPPRLLPQREFFLVDLAALLWRRRRFILGLTLAGTVLAAAAVFLWPPLYTAEAVLLPPQQPTSTAALAAGALSSLGGGGLASQLGVKNPADVYVGMLKSRNIADAVIAKNKLADVYQEPLASSVRRKLAERTKIEATKESMIHIAVDDRDPKRAAAIVTSYIDELYRVNSTLAISEAGQRRMFFQQQLAQEKDALADAEVAFRKQQEATGLVNPAGQAEATIRSQAQVRAEIASRQVQLQAMRSFATDQNPQVQLLEREIAALRQQLGAMESSSGGSKGSMILSGSQLPKNAIDFIRASRDLKYHEMLFEMLARQFETAKLDEAKSAPVLQIVDQPAPPDHKSWPPRLPLIALAAVIFFLIGALWSIAKEFTSRLAADPTLRQRITNP